MILLTPVWPAGQQLECTNPECKVKVQLEENDATVTVDGKSLVITALANCNRCGKPLPPLVLTPAQLQAMNIPPGAQSPYVQAALGKLAANKLPPQAGSPPGKA